MLLYKSFRTNSTTTQRPSSHNEFTKFHNSIELNDTHRKFHNVLNSQCYVTKPTTHRVRLAVNSGQRRFSTLAIYDEDVIAENMEATWESPSHKPGDYKQNTFPHVPVQFQIMRTIAAGDMKSAVNLIDSLAEEGIPLPMKVYCMLCSAYSKHEGLSTDKLQELFLKYYNMVKNLKVELANPMYNIILDAFAKRNRLDLMTFWYNQMKEEKLTPDAITFGLMIRGYCVNKEGDKALQTYEEIKTLGLRPHRSTYNHLIDLCRRKRDIVTVIKLSEEMFKFGIVPNEITFAGIIDAYGRKGDVENMLKYFSMMKEYNLQPDTPIFGAVIHAFGKKGDFDNMIKYFEIMKAAGYTTPNRVIYNIIIDSYGRGSQVDQMVRFFDEMTRLKLNPDSFTITSIISAYAKLGDVENMLKYFNILKQKFQPDFMVYNIVLTAYGKKQQHDKVIEWYNAMKEAKFRPNIVNYSFIITAYRIRKDKEALSRVIKELG